ncbi:MAG: 50S ribosomal protein L19 [Candidatus Moranbacteria bacterium]|nr:50S ribosomal protein L19 [Candidatus Moranbacteria bacterium]
MQKTVVEFNQAQRGEKMDIRAGDVVKIHRKIKEGDKERIQIFEGMVIAVKGGQSSSQMITVRKVSNGNGVEIIVPVISPSIEKIEMVKRAKVRRSKLYYIREKAAKALRFKFTDLSEKEKVEKVEKQEIEKTEEKKVEEVVEADKKEATEKVEEKK